MDIVLLVLMIVVLIALVILIVLLLRKPKEVAFSDHSKEMFDYLEKITKTNHESLSEIRREMNEFKTESSKTINDSYTSLLKLVTDQLNEMNKRVEGNLKTGFENNANNMKEVTLALGQITKAQANLDALKEEVTSLNGVLTNNQKRGRFGEIALESILDNVYGETHGLYETQYALGNDTRPDAVVFLPKPDNMVCIDSKFSFTSYAKLFDSKTGEEEHELRVNFKAALKQQVTKIASDYIKPGKTADYAIMFIPSDGIYAFLQSNDDFYTSIIAYARTKNVILTSPSTLQPILANIRMLQVNYEVSNNIKGVIAQIQKLRKENEKFLEDWTSVSKSIDALNKKKGDFDKRVVSINQKTDALLNQADKSNLLEPENETENYES